MGGRRTLLAVAAAALLAAAGIFLAQGPAGHTPIALAGPCNDGGLLFFEDDDEPGMAPLFAVAGEDYTADLFVDTSPSQLPPGKDPVTIEILGTLPAGLTIDFSPYQSDGSFDTMIHVAVGPDVAPGVYDLTVRTYCHEREAFWPFDIYVATCPTSNSGFASGGGGSGTQPFPSTCATSTPVPPTPTPSPTPTPTGTPQTGTPTPSGQTATATPRPLFKGDVDCSGSVDSADALKILLEVAKIPHTQPPGCPKLGGPLPQGGQAGSSDVFGDINCDNELNSVDALLILLHVAHLPVNLPVGCADIGT